MRLGVVYNLVPRSIRVWKPTRMDLGIALCRPGLLRSGAATHNLLLAPRQIIIIHVFFRCIMSRGLFSRAFRDANLSVTQSMDGTRSFRGGGSGRSRGGGRWQSRGRGRGRGGRGRGRGRSSVHGSNEVNPRFYSNESDEDIDMGEGGRPQTRYTPYGSRPPSHRHGNNHDDRSGSGNVQSRLGSRSSRNSRDWHRVVIPNGKNHGKEWLIKKLQNASEQMFQPVEFHHKVDSAVFLVEGNRTAEALRGVSHQITVRDGSKLIVSVRPCVPPWNASAVDRGYPTLDDKTEEVLKDCMSKRYDTTNQSLDLSHLFHDDVLKANGVQGILSHNHMASGILKLISENCPQIQSLDISNNKLYSLDSMKDLAKHAPNLRILNAGDNQIKAVEELDKLKGVTGLVSLVLEGNPLCDKYHNKETSYISAVRSRLPKITSLDGRELPPPIGFDLPSPTELPKVQGSFLSDPQIKALVLKFLEQYYAIYDSGDRQNLLDAYHDQAIFSMSVNLGMTANKGSSRGPSLGEYIKYSRNMRVNKPDQRVGLIKHTRLSVVAFLSELPSTKHDLQNFVIDVSLTSPSCLVFSVKGTFLEETKTFRSFSRTFVAVPVAGGKALTIINDELHIRNTRSQLQKSTGTGTSPSPSLFGDTANMRSEPVVPGGDVTPVTTPQQNQMVMQFSSQSGMNVHWSCKCLSDNRWNYEKAAQVFTELRSKGSVPPEAFVK